MGSCSQSSVATTVRTNIYSKQTFSRNEKGLNMNHIDAILACLARPFPIQI